MTIASPKQILRVQITENGREKGLYLVCNNNEQEISFLSVPLEKEEGAVKSIEEFYSAILESTKRTFSPISSREERVVSDLWGQLAVKRTQCDYKDEGFF